MLAPRSKASRFLLLLACTILILARTSGAHLHLCFDGAEQPASVHLSEDGDTDFHPGANGTHSDIDVSLIGEALLKKSTGGIDLLPMLVASFILLGTLLLGARNLPPRPRSTVRVPIPPFKLRPPLRGPPA